MLERLERHAGKLARVVLRGLGGGNASRLLGEGAAATLFPLPDWLASILDPIRFTFPSSGQLGMHWQSMEACLSAALEAAREHASARGFLRRFGIPGVGACRPEHVADPHQEPAASSEESEAVLVAQEPL